MERDHAAVDDESTPPALRHIRETLARLKKEKGIGGSRGRSSSRGSTSRRSSQHLEIRAGLRADMTLVPRAAPDEIRQNEGRVKRVPYLSFSATVKRNSSFYGLTADNIEELGGVEYRALCSLSWIIPVYYFGLLGVSFIVTAPYMTLPKWQVNFHPPLQHKDINAIWFSAFQIMGAWANTGMSLVDQNMVPFQTAYPMVIFIIICVLAGNTALPIFGSQVRRFTLSLSAVIADTDPNTSGTNLFFYLILDIGNPATESLPFGVKFIDAILDAAACRNAGYQPIPISSLMPAVQVLSVIMMYIAIFPIAMSVRATNVYEEKSLLIYESESEEDELNDDTHWNTPSESRVAIWGRYLLRHTRRQLSFDMWWLAVSLFLLCIIERSNLTDPAKLSYFSIFALLFELVSAYGTVGLSLGIPGANYSLSGGMHTLSKLVICAVMLRGRHRGLPVALDRAVLMPSEFLVIKSENQREGANDEKEARGSPQSPRFPQTLHNPDELAAQMRLRTRTISLVVEERRDTTTKDTKYPAWSPDRVPEESRDTSVDEVGRSDHHA
ncbi:hypothetical protein BN946_scf184970.g46 [Trametes cinnabarina]|uniref:Potassium transport protein n=1 Tax=Pycnoporus cinnabarinus TaxID=5643 RepID=A0A060SIZ0_PYCCI|nr:hypothetical protein BN946_scf184970.g46 [Trametes cinnabarina]